MGGGIGPGFPQRLFQRLRPEQEQQQEQQATTVRQPAQETQAEEPVADKAPPSDSFQAPNADVMGQMMGNLQTGGGTGLTPPTLSSNQAVSRALGGSESLAQQAQEIGGEAGRLQEVGSGVVPEALQAIGGEARPLQQAGTGGVAGPVGEAIAQTGGETAAPQQQQGGGGILQRLAGFGRGLFDRARGFLGGLFRR